MEDEASEKEKPFPVEQTTSNCIRVLSESEREKIVNEKVLISEYQYNKLLIEAQKNWDKFYKRNSTHFFKDRHWTAREFQELQEHEDSQADERDQKVLLEVGCGVGNAIFPLIEEGTNFFIHACDFSPRAVEFVKENPLFDSSKMNAFQCDITRDDMKQNISKCNVDYVTMIFVLSAIHPDKMSQTLINVHSIMREGGVVLFRDYGLYDHAMLRFGRGSKLDDHLYVRQDGTLVYYFTVDGLQKLFIDAGFETLSVEYIQRKTVNKQKGLDVARIFVQGKFKKR